MSNIVKENNWAVSHRLRFIESLAWWKGIVNRQEVVAFFNVSLAQASSDLQHYVDLNPEALNYNLRMKRYEATSSMKCVLTQPKLEDAVAMFLADDYSAPQTGFSTLRSSENFFGAVQIPMRECAETIERNSILAVLNSLRTRVRCIGKQDGKKDWHWVRPHALGYSGVSWFLRAWCETYDNFQDFSLNRILEIEWSRQHAPLPEPDVEWDEWTTIRLRANKNLSRPDRQSVELDYGMTNGVLEIPVRRAMLGYQLDRMGLSKAEGLPLLEITR
jgi:hypothetical protein